MSGPPPVQPLKPLKPWLAFASQLDMLQARGLEVEDRAAALYAATSGLAFAQWLRSLNFIRNVSAHHSRLWNINVVERAAVPVHWPVALDNARPFFYFGLMRQLLRVICPRSSWGLRVQALLEGEFPQANNAGVSLKDFGAFAGWTDAVPWKNER